MQQLSAQNEDLGTTIETLKEELILSHEEVERSSRELEFLRSKALQDNALEAAAQERGMLELQGELERCRIERDEWEHALLEERVIVDEAKAALASSRREFEAEKEARMKDVEELQREHERSANLQSVLEDFQSGWYIDGFCEQNLTVSLQPRSMKLDKPFANTMLSYGKQHNLLQSTNLVHYGPKCVYT